MFLGVVGQQAQHGQPDQEPVRPRPGAQAERRVERIALRTGEVTEAAEHGRAQGMQAGEGELHLGLHARRPRDPASTRGPRQVLEQRGLADARLAAQHQHPALARTHPRHEPLQHLAFAPTTDQTRRRGLRDVHGDVPLSGSRDRDPGSSPFLEDQGVACPACRAGRAGHGDMARHCCGCGCSWACSWCWS
jgi:hypothetical protein